MKKEQRVWKRYDDCEDVMKHFIEEGLEKFQESLGMLYHQAMLLEWFLCLPL